MSLVAGCPRCSVPVLDASCAEHPDAGVLWRAGDGYAGFAEVLRRAGGLPVHVPRPMMPGWTIADAGVAEDHRGRPVGTFTSLAAIHEVDGPVELTLVTEEPGVGLGGRVAGLGSLDPGPALGRTPASVRIRLEHHLTALWPVSAPEDAEPLATAVLVGEAHGRWQWVVVRPASAALLLQSEWALTSAATLGPAVVELPFGGPGPRW